MVTANQSTYSFTRKKLEMKILKRLNLWLDEFNILARKQHYRKLKP
jgi:hypothetical protein